MRAVSRQDATMSPARTGPFARYVALGDSSTEGIDDPDGAGAIGAGPNASRNASTPRKAADCSTPISPCGV